MSIKTQHELDEIGELKWYVVHVRSRHEFSVKERLLKSGIEAFLPIVERLSQWKDRKKLVSFPLFPGYLFINLHITSHEKLDVIKTPGVVRFIGQTPGEPEPVPDEQILYLKRLVESKVAIDPYPYLKEGNKVRIKSGPLAGVEGILVERKGMHHLVLSVDILRQGVSINIEASVVEAL
ncbi:MAG: UpxY family transcription antiterminator [Dissulfurispiraceae bacterium]